MSRYDYIETNRITLFNALFSRLRYSLAGQIGLNWQGIPDQYFTGKDTSGFIEIDKSNPVRRII